jgi:hypothetical protein
MGDKKLQFAKVGNAQHTHPYFLCALSGVLHLCPLLC